jgi:Reverse transcriptase (RNA-dependent DNA polymerase)
MKDLELQTTISAVHNFSSLVLSKQQLDVLGRGLNFAITPSRPLTIDQVNNAVVRFESSISSKHSTKVKPYINGLLPKLQSITKHHVSRRSNLNQHEFSLILDLTARTDIIIKPADKNLGIAIMDWNHYDQEVLRQLADTSTYRETGNNFLNNRLQALHRKITTLKKKFSNSFAESAVNYSWLKIDSLAPDNVLIPQFYILPKVHKLKPGDPASSLRGRPIVPGFQWLTTILSRWVSNRLTPLVKQHVRNLVSSTDAFIRNIDKVKVPRDCVFITMDIESLYTNINSELGVKYINYFLSDPELLLEGSLIEALTESVRLILTNNMFCYGNRLFLQIKGTAMGTPMAPPYANIFVFMLERDIINTFFDKTLIRIYYRYLDDLFLVCKNDPEIQLHFLTALDNLVQQGITYTRQLSHESAVFLDIEIYKGKRFYDSNQLDIRLYQKPMNLFLYIPFNSFHISSIKRNMITNELRRYIKCCSLRSEYIEYKKKFYTRLRARGYPGAYLIPLLNSVKYDERPSLLYDMRRKKKRSFTRFIIDNNPSISRSEMYSILNEGWPLNDSAPSLTFKRSKTLKDILCVNRIRSSSIESELEPLSKRRRIDEQ